jgi:hypothetical protein
MGNWQSPSGGRGAVTVFYRFFVLAKPAVRTPAACGPRQDKNMATSYRGVGGRRSGTFTSGGSALS